MKILIAAYYEFIKNMRDIKMILLLIICPIVMILILGNSIDSLFSVDSSKLIKVGYVNQDNGIVCTEFEKFLNAKEIKKRVDIVKYNSRQQGQKAINDGRVNSVIYIKAGLSQNIMQGKKQSILVYGIKDTEFIETLITGFTSTFNAADALLSIQGKPIKTDSGNYIKRIFFTKNDTIPDAIDYYSVLTLLQMLFIGAIFGIFIVTRVEGSDIHIRIHSLPVRRLSIVFGRILGSTVYLFITSIITLLFSKFVYHANFNGNIFIILGTLFIFCSIAIGTGVLAGLFISNSSSALMVVLLLMLLFSVVSGSISPTNNFDAITFISPNYHAKILIFGTIYGYSKEIMKQAALWLIGSIAVIYITIAAYLGRVRYDNI